ncbi:hypothetical protein ACSBR2_026049 [Camellia fascicularis]
MLFIVYITTNYQYRQTEIDKRLNLFYTSKDIGVAYNSLASLPRGIIQASSDLELKPLWSTSSSREKVDVSSSHNLLAIPVGIKQKTIVSIYDYIFLWDEDLGVENFHPGRYLQIVKSKGLKISQPTLDPNSTSIHHKITIRSRTNKFHRRVWDVRGSTKCSEDSEGPPCTGFVEGMAPVCSRFAWHCAWHLIQNDLVHGWGIDMKFGYCAQGDRTKKKMWE